MIIREFYAQREDGVNLYRTHSDAGMMILQTDTGDIYEDAVDVEDTQHTYEETDIPIDPGAPPDDLEESAAYLLRGGMVEIPDRDEDPDYFNEHEPEPEYFG